MSDALIGYTGFVGSNLDRQHDFEARYNSTNIQDINGKAFDTVVCAGTRAEKWRINQEPDKDLAEVDSLISNLRTVKTGKFILISTVDVYKDPVGVDEETPVDLEGLHAYGANRVHLEDFVRSNFDSLIVRLPGLFGPGLKKNVIYDLLHNNNVDKIHHAGTFQYYDLGNIWEDICEASENGLDIINFATEPVRTDEIADYAFGIKGFNNHPADVKPGLYDMRTVNASVYGTSGHYIYDKQQVLEGIKKFVEAEKDVS